MGAVTTEDCYICLRKLGLLPFKCRCDKYYCSKHKFATDHNCTYDYKKSHQIELAKNNPIIVGSKITKI